MLSSCFWPFIAPFIRKGRMISLWFTNKFIDELIGGSICGLDPLLDFHHESLQYYLQPIYSQLPHNLEKCSKISHLIFDLKKSRFNSFPYGIFSCYNSNVLMIYVSTIRTISNLRPSAIIIFIKTNQTGGKSVLLKKKVAIGFFKYSEFHKCLQRYWLSWAVTSAAMVKPWA